MREEKNRAAPLPDYHKCGAMSPDRERVLLRAIQIGRDAKEQLQQHTVRLEDIAAAQRDITNGAAAREELALSYFPLVAITARRYSYSSVPMDDLIQEGALGLLNIIDTYKDGPLNFPAFITIEIKQALGRLFKQKASVKIPPKVSAAVRKVNTVSKYMERDIGYEPQPEDIAEEMTISPAIVRKLLIYLKTSSAFSLDTPISDESGSATFEDLFVKDEPTPEELAERRELREQVREVLATLEPAEESTIRLRFGFVGGEVYTAEETADELKLPFDEEQRVEIKAMRKLRHPSRSSFLRDYL